MLFRSKNSRIPVKYKEDSKEKNGLVVHMLGCKKRKTLKMKRRKKTGDYLDAGKFYVIC